MICNNCGNNLPDGSMSCGYCGMQFANQYPNMQYDNGNDQTVLIQQPQTGFNPQPMGGQDPYGQMNQAGFGQPAGMQPMGGQMNQQGFGQPAGMQPMGGQMNQPGFGQPAGMPMAKGKMGKKEKKLGSGMITSLTIMVINLIFVVGAVFTKSCYKVDGDSKGISNNDVTEAIYNAVDGLEGIDMFYGVLSLLCLGVCVFGIYCLANKKAMSKLICMIAGIATFLTPIIHASIASGKVEDHRGEIIYVSKYAFKLEPEVSYVTLASLIGIGVFIACFSFFKKHANEFTN